MSTHLGDLMFGVIPNDEGLSAFIEHCHAAATIRESLNFRPVPGRPAITVLQPHPDDVALSIGGFLASVGSNVALLTIFGGSLGAANQRASEDAEFARVLAARLCYLDFPESTSSGQMPDTEPIEREVRASVRSNSEGGLLLAPAAIGRHPDHRVVHQIATSLGCGVFWEDVAFWGIYGSSVDDRTLFSLRDFPIAKFTLVAVNISNHIKSKAMLLGCYRSQSTEVWRPLRYAWTAARELDAPFDYCERLFVRDDSVADFERLTGSPLVRAGMLLYGARKVRTAWMGRT